MWLLATLLTTGENFPRPPTPQKGINASAADQSPNLHNDILLMSGGLMESFPPPPKVEKTIKEIVTSARLGCRNIGVVAHWRVCGAIIVIGSLPFLQPKVTLFIRLPMSTHTT